MSYSLGTCRHNNLTGYCPSCLREKSMRGMGRLNGMGQPMGDVFSDLLTNAQNAITGSLATTIATNPAIQAAGAQQASLLSATAAVNYAKAHPFIVGGAVLGVAALVLVGLKKL